MTINFTQAAPVAADTVRARQCPLCATPPDAACTDRGDHLARWIDAHTAGAIARADLLAVLTSLVVVTRWCVVSPELAALAAAGRDDVTASLTGDAA